MAKSPYGQMANMTKSQNCKKKKKKKKKYKKQF
jgi:hypothetical protein